MTTEHDYISTNKVLWDAKTDVHTDSEFYNNTDFLNGKSSLNDIELALLGDISGKSVLHLQCHFGQDTLSLARMGANATGVDLSDAAISKARELNDTLGLQAKFVCSDIYQLPEVLDEKFDIVFSSYGTIVWLPDLSKWADVIVRFLKPGGAFIFADFHPYMMMYDDDLKGIQYPYFNRGPIIETEAGTYADRKADIRLESVTWNHNLAEVMQSLTKAGLTIDSFHEYDYAPYPAFGNMKQTGERKYEVEGKEGLFPLVYALRATSKK